MNLESLPKDKAELAQSLLDLGLEEDEIKKSLDITEDIKEEVVEEIIEKSIEDQISEKKAELEALEAKVEKSEEINISGIDTKIDEISKSFINQLSESAQKSDERFEGLTTLIKSLTDVVSSQKDEFTSIKEENKKLQEQNEELKKSFGQASEILEKIANFSPGLQSSRTLSGAGFAQRFEKSESADGKEILSISRNKDEISTRISKLLDEKPELSKSLHEDIASFEVSSRVSSQLEKAFKDELGIEVVQ